MIRFLASGDLQIHKHAQFAYTTSSGMNSRLANCLRVLSFMRKTAIEKKISRILLNGDILEECDYIDVEVWDAVYTELEKMHEAGIEICINMGNHDIYGESGGRILHALRAFRQVAKVVEEPTLVWKSLFVVPWMSSAVQIRKAVMSCKSPEDYCLVLHAGIQGAVTGPKGIKLRNPLSLRDIRSTEFALTLLSDYHTKQRLQDSPPVWYLGSPIQHSFGEIHRPCIWEICLGGRGVSPRMGKIYTNFPRFRRVSVSNEQELVERTANFQGDFVKVSTDSESLSDERIERVAKKIGYQVDIRRSGDIEIQAQDSKSVSFNSAMQKYVEQHAKEKEHAKLLKLGMKIFNGEM